MPKIKTNKTVAKRFKIKNDKVLRRKAGQDHYNARESGNTTRKKRRDIEASDGNAKIIKKLMPYS